MAEEIMFYHNPRSRAVMAHWMLEEVGVPYRLHSLDFDKGENRTPEFLAINPMGKVPTIVHRGVVVTETAAIMAYLADAFPAAGLAPALDDPARGTYFRWLVFGASCFEPAVLDTMLKRPEPPRAAAGYGSYADVARTIEGAVRPGPFLLGERFSAADVYIASELAWAMSFGAPDLKESGPITAYVDHCRQRPACRGV